MSTIKIEQMNKDIERMPYGSAFMLSDFTDSIDYENVKKNAQILERKGIIRRVLRELVFLKCLILSNDFLKI